MQVPRAVLSHAPLMRPHDAYLDASLDAPSIPPFSSRRYTRYHLHGPPIFPAPYAVHLPRYTTHPRTTRVSLRLPQDAHPSRARRILPPSLRRRYGSPPASPCAFARRRHISSRRIVPPCRPTLKIRVAAHTLLSLSVSSLSHSAPRVLAVMQTPSWPTKPAAHRPNGTRHRSPYIRHPSASHARVHPSSCQRGSS